MEEYIKEVLLKAEKVYSSFEYEYITIELYENVPYVFGYKKIPYEPSSKERLCKVIEL